MKLMVIGLALFFAVPVFAVEPGHAIYVRGSVPTEPSDTVGTFDFKTQDALAFRTGTHGTDLVIPYSAIDHFTYTDEAAHRLGFFPALLIGMFAARERRHLFTITYRDSSDISQVVVFEVPKQDPAFLLPLLQRRTPACGDRRDGCGGMLQHHDF